MIKLNYDLNWERRYLYHVAPFLPAGPAAPRLLSAWPFPGQPGQERHRQRDSPTPTQPCVPAAGTSEVNPNMGASECCHSC